MNTPLQTLCEEIETAFIKSPHQWSMTEEEKGFSSALLYVLQKAKELLPKERETILNAYQTGRQHDQWHIPPEDFYNTFNTKE